MTSQDIHVADAMERDNTLNPRQLRTAGFIPGTLYAKGQESKNVQVRAHDFTQAYKKGARLFQLDGVEKGLVAMARQVQVEPVKQAILNVEFMLAAKDAEATSKVVY